MKDFQTVESELKLCQDGIKYLQLKKELLSKISLRKCKLASCVTFCNQYLTTLIQTIYKIISKY